MPRIKRLLRIKGSASVVDTTPPVISGLTITAITTDGATVSFLTNEAATTNLQYDTDPAFGSPTTVAVSATALLTHSKALTGLTDDETYYVRVEATDGASNTSGYSGPASFTTDELPAFGTPQNFTVTSTTGSPALDWDAVTGATSYSVLRAPAEDPYNLASIGTTASTDYADATAVAGTAYAYAVTATDGVDTSDPTSSRIGGKQGSGDTITLGALSMTTTFNSIGIILTVTGDTGKSANAYLEFKRASDDSLGWRLGLPLWRTVYTAASVNHFAGSVLLCDDNTVYDVRVVVVDAGGVSTTVASGQATTRHDNITPIYDTDTWQLLPGVFAAPGTYYVDAATGSDSDNGTTTALAWATVQKALASAPAGAKVVVRPGTYPPPDAWRTTAIHLMAEYAAVNDDGEIVNEGNHSIIRTPAVSTPGGTTWAQVSLTGPGAGGTHTVWKWTGAPISNAYFLCRSTTLTGEPQRVGRWDQKGAAGGYTLATPSGWAEVMALNNLYRYGFYAEWNDIYCRLPDDLDPNDYYMEAHGGAFTVMGDNIRVSGFHLRQYGADVQPTADDFIFDHNLVYNQQVNLTGTQPGTYGQRPLIERNRFISTSLWDASTGGAAGVPWNFIKGGMQIVGTSAVWDRVGASQECDAVSGRGGHQGTVIRHNFIRGYFNGVSDYVDGYDRFAMMNSDIHDNTFSQIPDDTIEPDGGRINWRVWNNRMDDVSVASSCGPMTYGPLYFFRNAMYMVGNHGVPYHVTGGATQAGRGVGAHMFKISLGSVPRARFYVIHNTFWTNDDLTAGGAVGTPGTTGNEENFYLRNNYIRATTYPFNQPFDTARWDEDYNHFATSSTDSRHGLGSYRTIAAYRTATIYGDHSNTVADITNTTAADALLTNTATGDLRLATTSALYQAGTRVQNISDLEDVHYSGDRPSIGYTEELA